MSKSTNRTPRSAFSPHLRVLAIVVLAPVIAWMDALASQVMGLLFVPLSLAATVAAILVLMGFEASEGSTTARAQRVVGACAIVVGLLGTAFGGVFLDWPTTGSGASTIVDWDWGVLGHAFPIWVAPPALAAIGVRMRSRGGWPMVGVVFVALLVVAPLKLAIWKGMYLRGSIVLGA